MKNCRILSMKVKFGASILFLISLIFALCNENASAQSASPIAGRTNAAVSIKKEYINRSIPFNESNTHSSLKPESNDSLKVQQVPMTPDIRPTQQGASQMAPPAVTNTYMMPIQTEYSHQPNPKDGLSGNRQISLTPFPNLDLQSGPLSKEQLPWYYNKPVAKDVFWTDTIEYQLLGGVNRSNGRSDGNGSLVNSLQMGFPFWREYQIGIQASGHFELSTFPTLWTGASLGFFRYAVWPDDAELRKYWVNRLSWGTVIDGLYDSEHRAWIGQWRTQFGFSLAPYRELGMWFTVPLQDDEAPIGTDIPILVDTTAQWAGYYRHSYPSEVDLTVFLGATEDPGGAQAGSYLTWHFSEQASLLGYASHNFASAGAYSLYVGIKFDFTPLSDYSLISGNPERKYRAFVRPIDHIQMQIRKNPR